MSAIRQTNWLGQMRVDVPHLKMLESSVTADFDLLAGQILGGKKGLVVKGFEIVTSGAVGAPAANLQVITASSILLHYQASENGSIFIVPSDRSPETLNSTNARVRGAFTASKVNYVGIDLRRSADETTSDVVMFIDPTTRLEQARTVPLARTLDYVIVISTTDFSATPTILPIARVQTDANNNVTELADARNMFGRLGLGGSIPNRYSAYSWPSGRKENTSGNVFTGGDKTIDSLKAWMDAVMSRIWEVGGGEYWYSPTSDRNVNMTASGSTFGNNEYFEWGGTNLHWQGLKFIFDNSTGWYNDVKDQTIDEAGLTDLDDGECIYVDIDRTQDRTGGDALQPVKAVLATLGAPLVPGTRFVIATRIGANVWTRGAPFPVGSFSALVPLFPDPSGSYTYASITVDQWGRVTAATDNPSIPAADIDYGGGNAWADGTTNPAVTVEAQLDKIINVLAAVGGGGGDGASKVGSDATTHMLAGTLRSQIEDLDDKAARIDLQNIFAEKQTFNGTSSDLDPMLESSYKPTDRAQLWKMKAATVSGNDIYIRLFYGPNGWEATINADWKTGAPNRWEPDFNGIQATKIVFSGSNFTLYYKSAAADWDDTDWEGYSQLYSPTQGGWVQAEGRTTTVNATPVALWTYTPPDPSIVHVKATIVAKTGTDYVRFVRERTFKVDGAVSNFGSEETPIADIDDNAGLARAVALNDNASPSITLYATGAALANTDWTAFIEYTVQRF